LPGNPANSTDRGLFRADCGIELPNGEKCFAGVQNEEKSVTRRCSGRNDVCPTKEDNEKGRRSAVERENEQKKNHRKNQCSECESKLHVHLPSIKSGSPAREDNPCATSSPSKTLGFDTK
jgi:hypothetical protein